MLVLVICKLEDNPIKTEGAIMSTTFFLALKGRYSKVDGNQTGPRF